MFTDMDDAIAPVKYYINDRISTGLNPSTVKNFDFFIQEGYLKRSWLLRSWKEDIFAMGKFREYDSIVTDEGNERYYLDINVRLDDTKINVKRQEYTFDMWFIAIGGLERVWSRIFGMVVGAVSKPLMVNSFLGALFLMKNNRDEDALDDSSDPDAPNYHGHRPAYGHRYDDDNEEESAYANPPTVKVKNMPPDVDDDELQKLFSAEPRTFDAG